jgi:hypothetical protein
VSPTQFTAWRVDHAQEGAIIIIVDQQAQVGQHIFHKIGAEHSFS